MAKDLISFFGQHAIWLPLGLFVATLIVEDLATIAAALLAARAQVDPAAALAAVTLGTAMGDLALYALGRWGADSAWGRRVRERSDVRKAENWLEGRLLLMAFAARFLPGSRLPIYIASGLARSPFLPFAAIIAVTTPVWTGLLFTLTRLAGEAGAQQFARLGLGFGAAVLIAVILPRPVWFRRLSAKV